MMTTRCMGLNEERHRCDAAPLDASGYCAQHCMPNVASALPRRKENWLARWRPPIFDARVPDDVKLPVPRVLRNRPLDELVTQLSHGADTYARWSAAYALRRRRDPAALEALWQVLHHEPVALVRQQAMVALGKIGTPQVVSPLVEALWHDVDPGVRQASAIALGNLGERMVVRELVQVLEREPAIFVRWDCVLALGQLGDASHENFLATLATQERTEVIRRACHEALAQIRERVPTVTLSEAKSRSIR